MTISKMAGKMVIVKRDITKRIIVYVVGLLLAIAIMVKAIRWSFAVVPESAIMLSLGFVFVGFGVFMEHFKK